MEYSHHISQKELAKQTIFPSFSVILYAESILNDAEVTSLCLKIRTNFEDVAPVKVVNMRI